MNHPALFVIAMLAAVLVVSVSAFPARTAPEYRTQSWDAGTDQNVQSAGVHALVGASFHAVHASF
jgi:hypothetical protein